MLRNRKMCILSKLCKRPNPNGKTKRPGRPQREGPLQRHADRATSPGQGAEKRNFSGLLGWPPGRMDRALTLPFRLALLGFDEAFFSFGSPIKSSPRGGFAPVATFTAATTTNVNVFFDFRLEGFFISGQLICHCPNLEWL